MLIFLSVSGPPQLCVDCGRALARDGTQRYIRSQKTRSKCRRSFTVLNRHIAASDLPRTEPESKPGETGVLFLSDFRKLLISRSRSDWYVH